MFFLPVKVSFSAVLAPEPPKEVTVTRPTVKEYAKLRVEEVFGSGWPEFERIIHKESGWEVIGYHYPKSKISSATGLCGMLTSTFKSIGYERTEDPYKQIEACIKYTKVRYGNPQKALKAHLQKNWW